MGQQLGHAGGQGRQLVQLHLFFGDLLDLVLHFIVDVFHGDEIRRDAEHGHDPQQQEDHPGAFRQKQQHQEHQRHQQQAQHALADAALVAVVELKDLLQKGLI